MSISLPLKKVSIPTLLLLIFFLLYSLNLYYLIELKSSQNNLQTYIDKEKSKVDIDSYTSYLKSNSYKQVYFKEQGYRFKNEQALDTREYEPNIVTLNQDNNLYKNLYLKKTQPNYDSKQASLNVLKWYDCLSNKDEKECF
jgi:hypothetical protein